MDISQRRLVAALARQTQERATAQAARGDYGDAGPPFWNQSSWEGYKNQYGSYPFGPQPDGSMIYPPSFEEAPDWVFELMNLRKPPVGVKLGG